MKGGPLLAVLALCLILGSPTTGDTHTTLSLLDKGDIQFRMKNASFLQLKIITNVYIFEANIKKIAFQQKITIQNSTFNNSIQTENINKVNCKHKQSPKCFFN